MKTSEILVRVRSERDTCAARLQKLDRAIEALEDLGDEDEPASPPVRAVAEPKPVAAAKNPCGRKPGVKRISDEFFVAAWNEAESPSECATKLGMKLSTASSRASLLRDTHDLKRFHGGPKPTVTPAPKPSRKPLVVVEDSGQRQCLGCFVLVTPPKVRCAVCAEKSVRDRA